MYPRNHMLLQWVFNMPGAVSEQGVGSLRFDAPEHQVGDFPIGQVDSDEAFDQVWQTLQDLWGAQSLQVPTSFTLQGAKWNQIDRNGHYVTDNTRFRDLGSNPKPGGQNAGIHYPNQVTWVSTYTTEASRGLAHAGRTYWPTAVPLGTDSRVTTAAATAAGASLVAALEDWGNWDGPDITSFAPCVMSKVGNGASRYIRGVAMGRVLDTQRRRRNAQLEDPVHQAVADPNG